MGKGREFFEIVEYANLAKHRYFEYRRGNPHYRFEPCLHYILQSRVTGIPLSSDGSESATERYDGSTPSSESTFPVLLIDRKFLFDRKNDWFESITGNN